MSTTLLLELFAGFLTAFVALWMVVLNQRSEAVPAAMPAAAEASVPVLPALRGFLSRYFLRDGVLRSTGLLVLRLAIGTMMIHHGHDKLANPQAFADTYVAPLHLPFPLLLAYVAGYSEILGSWLVILGLLTPLGALALSGTMAVAAYHHILTAGLNIYVLELVVLYLGGSVALLLSGPGRWSFDAGIVAELVADAPESGGSSQASDASRPSLDLASGAA